MKAVSGMGVVNNQIKVSYSDGTSLLIKMPNSSSISDLETKLNNSVRLIQRDVNIFVHVYSRNPPVLGILTTEAAAPPPNWWVRSGL